MEPQEKKIKAMMLDNDQLRKQWKSLDFNGRPGENKQQPGGAACLTLLVQRRLSSNVANHVANSGDPSLTRRNTHKTHESVLY